MEVGEKESFNKKNGEGQVEMGWSCGKRSDQMAGEWMHKGGEENRECDR